MKLKAFRVYTLVDPEQRRRVIDEEILDQVLPEIESFEPGPHTWATLGVVPAAPRGDRLYHRSTENTLLLQFRFCERILPSGVINDLVDRRVGEMLQAEGYDRRSATKKERAQIKSEVVAERLPNALVKTTTFPVFIRGDRIIVGATSGKQCEDTLGKLRAAFGSLRVLPLETRDEPTSLLRRIAAADSAPRAEDTAMPMALLPGFTGTMVDHEDSKTSFANTPVDSDLVVEALHAGYNVTELEVLGSTEYSAGAHPAVRFKLNKALAFKGFKLAEGLIEDFSPGTTDLDDEDLAAMSQFDADVILTATFATAAIDAVESLLGGRTVSPEEEKIAEEHGPAMAPDDFDDL